MFFSAVYKIPQCTPPKLGTRNGERESGNECTAGTRLTIQNSGQMKINGYNLGKCQEENLDMPPDDRSVLVRTESD